MTGAIVVSWGTPVRGREAKGLEVFGQAVAYFEGLSKQGRIHGHKEFFGVTGNASRAGGFMLIEGNLDELMRIQTEEETTRLLAKSSAIVENLTVQIFAGGSDRAVQERVTTYMETGQELGYL